jgi:hypothetical protein
MSERDLMLVAMVRQVVADGAAPRAELIESLAYGNLKFEDPGLERSTMAAAARAIAREKR